MLQVDPVDAGTDNGFTFTAPNWPTEPQGLIYRVTSRYPAHPASSFYYPYMKRLPAIATFQFIKVRTKSEKEISYGWKNCRGANRMICYPQTLYSLYVS